MALEDIFFDLCHWKGKISTIIKNHLCQMGDLEGILSQQFSSYMIESESLDQGSCYSGNRMRNGGNRRNTICGISDTTTGTKSSRGQK